MAKQLMKRLLSFSLALLLLLSCLVLAGCQPKQSTTDAPSSSDAASSQSTALSPSPSVSGKESLPESSKEEIPDLPSSATLVGTKHLPIPDHQGSIGSCTAEGVAYTQFTVAVSQFIHATDPDTDWDPSSGDNKYIFSPKFTYNYAGPSTENAYTVLLDHGCLPMSISSFYKSTRPASQPYQNPSYLGHDQTRSWDVSKGLMEKALKYRLTGFEETDFTATQSGQLTTKCDLSLFYKVKDALARGNSVTICGWPVYMHYTKIAEGGQGSIAQVGESVAWTGMTTIDRETGSGNHCVSIVGYDDEITVTAGGVELKGAFQIRDSYANDSRDIYYIMYDAFNLVSEHAELNDPNTYLSTAALTIPEMKFQYGYFATQRQTVTFTPTGALFSLSGKEYPVYTLSDASSNAYLTLRGTSFGRGGQKDATSFALISFDDLASAQQSDYKGGYLLAALDENSKIAGYLGAEVNTNNASIRFYKDSDDPKNICFDVDYKKEGTFTSRVSLTKENPSGYKRTGTVYRFSFIYWDEDIEIGTPDLMVEAEISAVGRENLYMTLSRTDKNGTVAEYVPASMNVRINKAFLPELDFADTVSFSGKNDPTRAETGYFTFGYHTLQDYGEDYDYTNFLWGINIRGTGITVKALRLLDKNGKELCAVKIDEANRTLKAKETKHYEFQLSNDLKTYLGAGSYTFYNAGTKKTLSLQSNNMLFEWRKDSNKGSVDRSVFRVEYDKASDSYLLRHGTKDYVFDIAGEKLAAGTTVKMNAPSALRDTQQWSIVVNDDGSLCIASKKDPSLVLGYNGKEFCLGSDKNDPNFRFNAQMATESTRILDLTLEKTKVSITAAIPKEYDPKDLTLHIVKDGTVLETLKGTTKETVMTFEKDLEKGDYLFCLCKDGVAIGNQIAVRIG